MFFLVNPVLYTLTHDTGICPYSTLTTIRKILFDRTEGAVTLPFDDYTTSAGQVYQGSPCFISGLISSMVRPVFSGSGCQGYVPGLSVSMAAPDSGTDERIPLWRY